MAYIDEEIAKKFKKERLKKQKEEQERIEKELEATVDPGLVRQGIIEGKCIVLDREFEFEKYTICDGRFSIYIPQTGSLFKIMKNHCLKQLITNWDFPVQ